MQEIDKNIDMRKGKRVPIGVGINSFLHDLDESDEASKKAFRTAKVQNLFKDCVKHIYGASAFLILQSVNAVYILNEKDKGMLKKATPQSKNIKRLIIYTNDSLVYSDLDARQEQIKLWFNDQGERLDKLDLISSKFNMRKRFPFESEVALLKKTVVDTNVTTFEKIDPQNLKILQDKVNEIKNENLRKSLQKLIEANS